MHRRFVLLLALVVAIALQSLLGGFKETGSLDDRIVGPDSFMRLQRVIDLHTHGTWYNAHQSHINAPIGQTLHWTRPMDALIYACAAAISVATDFRTSVLISGIAISPLLMFAMILVWSWATRDLLDDTAFLLSIALLGLLHPFMLSFTLGRPDHHSLLMFLFVVQLAVLTKSALGKAGARHLALGGITCAGALWVSIEALIHLLLFGWVLCLFWLCQGGPYLKQLTVFLAAMAATLVVALAIERPPAMWFAVQYDRLSIVHVILVAAGAATWTALFHLSRLPAFRQDIGGRMMTITAGCAVPGAVMATLFPNFFTGPFTKSTSPLLDQWLDLIGEYQALVPVDRFTTSMFLAYLGPALIALAFTGLRWRSSGDAERRLHLLWLAGLAICVPLTLDAVRWSAYVQAVAWLPWTLAIIGLARHPWKVAFGRLRLPMNAIVTLALALGPVALSLAILPASKAEAEGVKPRCDWALASEYLKSREDAPDSPIMLTHVLRGPEVAWRSGYRMANAPYHNNDSLKDTAVAFGADDIDVDVAWEVIRRRRVRYVLICPAERERGLYGNDRTLSLYTRLARREAPDWLREIDLPPALTEAYRLYRVVR